MMDCSPLYGLAVQVTSDPPQFQFYGEPKKCIMSARALRERLPAGTRKDTRIVPGEGVADFPRGLINGWIIDRNAIEFATPLWGGRE